MYLQAPLSTNQAVSMLVELESAETKYYSLLGSSLLALDFFFFFGSASSSSFAFAADA